MAPERGKRGKRDNPQAVATGGGDQTQLTLSQSVLMVLRFASWEVERTRKMSVICCWYKVFIIKAKLA